ncbi:hypothetical protein M378DRAFT_13660 [Amanita muscaria Koide BX008]|uniref:Uncharacterized protein n=1 Tax=Amanita muscaria (strain Koide BX008) TaxID=946122 RepID=A0A0C2WXV9_AMAMK|nr:hypothetical protein M378DRAFT_13660 [Amanita muscaria Koide BX008]
MSSASKGKSKADPTGPSIRVEEMPHELSREERPFRLNRKERLQNLSPIPPSHSRTASGGPSESGKRISPGFRPYCKSQHWRSVEIENYLGESFKPTDRWMGFERASEEAIVETEDQSVDFPMSTLEEIAEHCRQTPQDSIQGSKHHVQVMGTIGGGVVEIMKDSMKPEDLIRISSSDTGHPRQDYDNSGTPKLTIERYLVINCLVLGYLPHSRFPLKMLLLNSKALIMSLSVATLILKTTELRMNIIIMVEPMALAAPAARLAVLPDPCFIHNADDAAIWVRINKGLRIPVYTQQQDDDRGRNVEKLYSGCKPYQTHSLSIDR